MALMSSTSELLVDSGLGTRSFILAEEGDDDRDLSEGKEGLVMREKNGLAKMGVVDLYRGRELKNLCRPENCLLHDDGHQREIIVASL